MSTVTLHQQDRDRRAGAIGTVVFHVVLILLFLFFGLTQPNPLPKDEGIELVFESAGGLSGGDPAPNPGSPQESAASIPTPTVPEDVATEEESPVETPKPVKPQPKPKPQPSEPKPPKPNPNALFTPSGNPNQTTNPNPGGSNSNANTPGGGGVGSFHGPGFEGRLDGRGTSRIPTFRNDNTEAGIVAVDIKVDANGKVIYAKGKLDRPTTTTSPQLHALAEGYAKQFQFTVRDGSSLDQVGYIVFNFTVK